MSGFIYGVSDGLFVDVFRMIARVEELEGRLLCDDDTTPFMLFDIIALRRLG